MSAVTSDANVKVPVLVKLMYEKDGLPVTVDNTPPVYVIAAGVAVNCVFPPARHPTEHPVALVPLLV